MSNDALDGLGKVIKMYKPRREWCSVELSRSNAELLKAYLNKYGIYFEPSEAYYLIHFEILMKEDEIAHVNRFLDTIGRDRI